MLSICSKRRSHQCKIIMQKTCLGECMTSVVYILAGIAVIAAVIYALYRYNAYAADINNAWLDIKPIDRLIEARTALQFFSLFPLFGIVACCWCMIDDAHAKLIREMDIYDEVEAQSDGKRKN